MAYSGPERRQDRCEVHEEQTKDIATIKTRLTVWQTVLGAVMSIGLAVMLFMLQSLGDKLDRIDSKLDSSARSISSLEAYRDYSNQRLMALERR